MIRLPFKFSRDRGELSFANPIARPEDRTVRRYLIPCVLALAVGFGAGRVPVRPPPAPAPPTGEITILRTNRPADSGVPLRFRIHSYAVGGNSVSVSAPPAGADVWIITQDTDRGTVTYGAHPAD